MFYISILVLLSAVVVFIHVAWSDFLHWKISNQSVLMLIALFLTHAFTAKLAGGELSREINILFNLGAGLLLFTIGVILWILKLFGAGDAKLFFPVGLFLGWNQLVLFSIGLLGAGIFVFILLKSPLPEFVRNNSFGLRIDELRQTRKAPYGVVIILPLLLIIWLKYIPIISL